MADEFTRFVEAQPDDWTDLEFDLRTPIYRKTTNYGHFGKPELSWER